MQCSIHFARVGLDIDFAHRPARRSRKDVLSMFGEDIGTYNGYCDEVVLRKYLELIN